MSPNTNLRLRAASWREFVSINRYFSPTLSFFFFLSLGVRPPPDARITYCVSLMWVGGLMKGSPRDCHMHYMPKGHLHYPQTPKRNGCLVEPILLKSTFSSTKPTNIYVNCTSFFFFFFIFHKSWEGDERVIIIRCPCACACGKRKEMMDQNYYHIL